MKVTSEKKNLRKVKTFCLQKLLLGLWVRVLNSLGWEWCWWQWEPLMWPLPHWNVVVYWQNVPVDTSCHGVHSTIGPWREEGLTVNFNVNQKSTPFKSTLQDVILVVYDVRSVWQWCRRLSAPVSNTAKFPFWGCFIWASTSHQQAVGFHHCLSSCWPSLLSCVHTKSPAIWKSCQSHYDLELDLELLSTPSHCVGVPLGKVLSSHCLTRMWLWPWLGCLAATCISPLSLLMKNRFYVKCSECLEQLYINIIHCSSAMDFTHNHQLDCCL